MSETTLPTTAAHSSSGMKGGWNTSFAAGTGKDPKSVYLALDSPSYGIYAQGEYNWLQGNLTVGAESVQPDTAPTGNALDVSGNATIGGMLTTTGALTTKGGLTVTGGTNTDTLNAAGNATIGGTLTTTGALTTKGGLTVTSGTNTDTLTATGNATIGGTLTTSKLLAANGSLTVAGGTNTDTLDATGNATIGGTLTTTGALKANGGLTVTGDLNVKGDYYTTLNTKKGYSIEMCTASDFSKGTVGIGGWQYNDAMFSVNGACLNPSGSWVKNSDLRLKQDVRPYGDGLAHLLKLDPIRYRHTEESKVPSTDEYVGVSAQNAREVAPYMVTSGKIDRDGDEEYLRMDPGPLTYMLINAVKELHAEIEKLKGGTL